MQVIQQGAANLLFAAFGPVWRAKAPAALGYSRRSVQRWVTGEVRLPPAVRHLLERLLAAAAQSRAIERWRLAEHQRIDAATEEWRTAASNAPTRLRLIAIEDERNPPPRVGRPRKRRRLAPWEWEPDAIIPARVPVSSPLTGVRTFALPTPMCLRRGVF
jgi:hypothetical protein